MAGTDLSTAPVSQCYPIGLANLLLYVLQIPCPGLHMAAMGGHLDVVRLLLDRGANMEAPNEVNAVCRPWYTAPVTRRFQI
jgi:hypothetical protein